MISGTLPFFFSDPPLIPVFFCIVGLEDHGKVGLRFILGGPGGMRGNNLPVRVSTGMTI